MAEQQNVTTGISAQDLSFQSRVQPWMNECFGSQVSVDQLERGDRLLEEVLELLQSASYPRERIAALTGYVYGRPAGDPAQEVGGVMVTLAAYCLAHDLDMHRAGEAELRRVWDNIEKIRAKQAKKPTGSALPLAAHEFATFSFSYRNWRGEVSGRRVIHPMLHHGCTEWYPEPQWLLRAYDLDKGAERTFAVSNILSVPVDWADRLAAVLGQLIDEPLLTLPGTGLGAVRELHVRDFRPDLSETAAVLLEEMGL